MSQKSPLHSSSTHSLASKFALNEPPMGMASECPQPSQGKLQHDTLLDGMQDSHPRGSNTSDSSHDRVDIPFYASQLQQSYPKCPLDISVDRYLTHDGSGAPTNPHNTPASNSEQTSHGSSDAGSYGQDNRDLHAVSNSQSENLNFGWLNESQCRYAGYHAYGDEKLRRRRQPKSSITDPTFGVFSPPHASLERARSFGAEEPDDTAPPFLRSPQFSPPPSFFRPSRIRFLRQHSSSRRSEYLPADRSIRPRKPRGSHRRHIQRPFPYYNPARSFHIPMEHTDRFPIPFPSILKLPFRRESPTRLSIEPVIQNGKTKNIRNLLLGIQKNMPTWQRLRECTMARVSLHKSLSSNSDFTSYICYLRVNQSTISIRLSRTTKPDKRAVSPAPAVDGSMVLFQISFLIPMLFLRVSALLGSLVQRLGASGAVSAIIGFVDAGMSLLVAFTVFMLRMFRLKSRFGLEVN